jgi:hypothetical protein
VDHLAGFCLGYSRAGRDCLFGAVAARPGARPRLVRAGRRGDGDVRAAYGVASLKVFWDVKKANWDRRWHHAHLFWRGFGSWTSACVVSGGVLFGLEHLAFDAKPEWIVAIGPILVILTHVLQSTIYVALRPERPLADMDREWLARVNGQKLFLRWA